MISSFTFTCSSYMRNWILSCLGLFIPVNDGTVRWDFCYGTQTHHLVLFNLEGFNKNCSLISVFFFPFIFIKLDCLSENITVLMGALIDFLLSTHVTCSNWLFLIVFCLFKGQTERKLVPVGWCLWCLPPRSSWGRAR